jgi:hypothetical protein
MKIKSTLIFTSIALVVISAVYLFGWQQGQANRALQFISEAEAAGGVVKGPNTVAPERYVYYPGTEVLAEDEIRVVACGTGMPAARRGQAATCYLVETGNGDKFIFGY